MADTATPTQLKPSEIHVEEGFNPRTEIDKKKLEELAASIKSEGIIQPLIVSEPDDKGKHQLIAGHRRFAAAKLLKLRELPVVVRNVNGNATAIAVIENLQREDLNPIDEANGFAAVMEAEDIRSQKDLAERLGVSTSQVSDRLKMLKLHPTVQDLFRSRTLPAAAANFIEKAQRVSEPLAAAIAEVLAEDTYDVASIDDYDQVRELLLEAGDRVATGDYPEELGECGGVVDMTNSFISARHFKINWPNGTKKIKNELQGWAWNPSWTEEDFAAAKQYGCLFEHKAKSAGEAVTVRFAVDRDFVVALMEQKFDVFKEEQAKEKAKRDKSNSKFEREQAERKREREERAAEIQNENIEFLAAFPGKRGELVADVDEVRAICRIAIEGTGYSGYFREYFALSDPAMEAHINTMLGERGDWKALSDASEILCAYVDAKFMECTTVQELLDFTLSVLVAAACLQRPHGDPVGEFFEVLNDVPDPFEAIQAAASRVGLAEHEEPAPAEEAEAEEAIDSEQIQEAAAEHAEEVAAEVDPDQLSIED